MKMGISLSTIKIIFKKMLFQNNKKVIKQSKYKQMVQKIFISIMVRSKKCSTMVLIKWNTLMEILKKRD
jgi:hypothetical protein